MSSRLVGGALCTVVLLSGACTTTERSPDAETCRRIQQQRLVRIEEAAKDAVGDIPQNLSFMRQRFIKAIHDRPVTEERGQGVGGGKRRYIERDPGQYDEAAGVIKHEVRRLARALEPVACQ